jgi:hypothetical protein
LKNKLRGEKRRERTDVWCGVVWCLIQDPAQESGNNEEKISKDSSRVVMPSSFLPSSLVSVLLLLLLLQYR